MISCKDNNGFDDTKICQELIMAVQEGQKYSDNSKKTNKKEGQEITVKDQEDIEFW